VLEIWRKKLSEGRDEERKSGALKLHLQRDLANTQRPLFFATNRAGCMIIIFVWCISRLGHWRRSFGWPPDCNKWVCYTESRNIAAAHTRTRANLSDLKCINLNTFAAPPLIISTNITLQCGNALRNASIRGETLYLTGVNSS
jgi:hypothetical protein